MVSNIGISVYIAIGLVWQILQQSTTSGTTDTGYRYRKYNVVVRFKIEWTDYQLSDG